MDTIFIKQLAVQALIGVYEQERENKQLLLIDVDMKYNSAQARASDNIKYALDYHTLSIEIEEFVSLSSYQLIESLAHGIADLIMRNELVETLSLTIYKPQAIENTTSVGIVVKRSRHQ